MHHSDVPKDFTEEPAVPFRVRKIFAVCLQALSHGHITDKPWRSLSKVFGFNMHMSSAH